MPHYPDPVHGFVIEADRLRDWTCALVRRVGTPPDIAADVAEILLASDLRGIASHGTARLPQYVKLVEAKAMDPAATPAREPGEPHRRGDRARPRDGGGDLRRPEHEPLRHRRLVRDAGRRARHDRRQPD